MNIEKLKDPEVQEIIEKIIGNSAKKIITELIKLYEILSYKYEDKIYKLNPNKDAKYKWLNYDFFEYKTEKELINNSAIVQSIKILSNNMILSIGDEIIDKLYNKNKYTYYVVDSIKINNPSYIYFSNIIDGKHICYIFIDLKNEEELNKLNYCKKLLFITEDGIKVYNNDIKLFLLNKSDFISYNINSEDYYNSISFFKDWLAFSTKEKMDEYILHNEKFLSFPMI